jgi:poly-gamma-glutamate capsule biosynthesis protein CapA/YwtB (metallophosphatase superfamily)
MNKPKRNPANRKAGKLSPAWRNASVPDGFTLVAVGDLLIDDAHCARLERESPGLLELLRSADVTLGNFETTAIDLNKFGGWPEAESGGSWLISTPVVPQDARAMGFNLMSRANNHTTDWGVAGMRCTDALLDEAGIVHAGTGETLAAARAPRFLKVPAGRIALVSFASRFEVMSRAADPLGRVRGRPGLSALRATRRVLVSREQFAQLQKLHAAQPQGSVRASELASDRKNGTVTLFGTRYAPGAKAAGTLQFSFKMNERDRAQILRSIRQGKQTAEFAIAAMHTHEPGNYSAEPPDFMETMAREAVDNGADAVVGHGPHQLRGIEIYKRRPVFYSLGNFFFMENTQQPLTPDAYEKEGGALPADMTEAEFLEHKRVHGVFGDRVWYESVVAVNRFDRRGNLTAMRLHPIEMHWDNARDADRGIPRLAPPDVAMRILERLQKLSKPYGTRIDVRDGVGIVAVA